MVYKRPVFHERHNEKSLKLKKAWIDHEKPRSSSATRHKIIIVTSETRFRAIRSLQ